MWRNYDPEVIRGELRVLAEHGLSMTRSVFYWPDFMPEPDRIDEQMAARFADFLDRHSEAGMTTVPTFIVGHMSGENWDPPWRDGRDLYSDVWMVARQAWFAGEMVRRFGGHEAVCGWLVSNEMPIYGGEAPRETIAAWSDYDGLAGQDPYRHHAFEMHFGLTDARGKPKPQLAEMAAFAGILRQVDITRCGRSASDAALVVPSYLDTRYPFTQEQDRSYLAEMLRQSYVSARLADLPLALTRESDGISRDARLYLVPSTKQLLSPTWHELEELAHAGAVVYVSYSPAKVIAVDGHDRPALLLRRTGAGSVILCT